MRMEIKWMRVIWFIIQLMASESMRSIHVVCDGALCLHLYDRWDQRVTWQQSYDACISEGLQLVQIDNIHVQTLVTTLLRVIPVSTQGDVWTAGRGSGDGTWRYMDGTDFPYSGSVSDRADACCVYVTLHNDSTPGITYHADYCDERNTGAHVMCQYPSDNTGGCLISYGGACYRYVYIHQTDQLDWFGAQSYCSSNNTQGVVAYSNFDDADFQKRLLEQFENPSNFKLWVGMRKRIWHWRTGPDPVKDRSPINYFFWHGDSGRSSDYYYCIYIDHGRGDKWSAQPCNIYLRYYICMNETVIITTATTTTAATTTKSSTPVATTQTTTLTTTVTQSSTISSTPSAPSSDITPATAGPDTPPYTATAGPDTLPNNGSGYIQPTTPGGPKPLNPALIAAMVIVVALVSVAIGLSVFCLRKHKKSKQSNRPDNINDTFDQDIPERDPAVDNMYNEIEATYAMATSVDDAAYAEIGGHSDVTPRADTGIGKRMSAFFSKRKLPNLPSMRRTSATDNHIEHGDLRHDKRTNHKHTMDARARLPVRQETDNESYAEVTSGDQPATSNGNYSHATSGEETTIIDNEDYAGATSSEVTTTGRKVLNHLKTAQGDLYALPDKSGNIPGNIGRQIEHIVTEDGDVYALPMKKSVNVVA